MGFTCKKGKDRAKAKVISTTNFPWRKRFPVFPCFHSVFSCRKITWIKSQKNVTDTLILSYFCVNQSAGLRPVSTGQRSLWWSLLSQIESFFWLYQEKGRSQRKKTWQISFHFLCSAGCWDECSFQGILVNTKVVLILPLASVLKRAYWRGNKNWNQKRLYACIQNTDIINT